MSKQPKVTADSPAPVATDDKWRHGLSALEESIQEFLDSLKEIRAPLKDSSSALPKATSQLDRISEQTQVATNKVLDLVDDIANSQNEIIKTLNEVINLVADDSSSTEAISGKLESAEECANRTLNDTYTIMDALQFQDITTQQMDHAASLLEDVEGKLNGIIGEISSGDNPNESSEPVAPKKVRAFDPHADMEFKHTDQSGVDDIISSSKEK